MIKKLQRNFIRIAALALLSVILIVIASINGVFLYQCNQLLDNKLEDMLIRHTGKQDDTKNKPKHENAPAAKDPGKKRTTSPFDIFPLLHQNMQSSSACCVVILDSDYTIQTVRQNIEDSFSDEDLENYISVIRQRGKDHGWNQFITDAGHELKTPLTVISANSELARMTYGDSEWFDGIDRQVQRMNKLVRELISILIDNAAKYCEESGTVHVELHTVNSKIRLAITNDFPDVENCDFSAIFDRFYRADKSRKSDGSYGLGLSIAKNIVEIHHGTIAARAAGATKMIFEVVFKN